MQNLKARASLADLEDITVTAGAASTGHAIEKSICAFHQRKGEIPLRIILVGSGREGEKKGELAARCQLENCSPLRNLTDHLTDRCRTVKVAVRGLNQGIGACTVRASRHRGADTWKGKQLSNGLCMRR